MLFPLLPPSTWLTVLLLALGTEFLDGFLARRLNATSKLGRYLDPLADKTFVISVAITLASANIASPQVFFLVLIRDIVVITGTIIMVALRQWDFLRQMKPAYPGKIATTCQFIFLCSTVYFKQVIPWLLYPTAVSSIIAACYYLMMHLKSLPKTHQ